MIHSRIRHVAALLAVAWLPVAEARTPKKRIMKKVPSIEAVVKAEGFVPTLSQSEVYRPGAVLVPNGRGGHDMVLEDCIGAQPQVAFMSESSIATTLSAGVSARLAAQRAGGHAKIERRLTFVDPEQRTLALASLAPLTTCVDGVEAARRFQDLSEAFVVYDVLLAIVKNTSCVRIGSDGRIVELVGVEAETYLECVKESDVQVPLGYKPVPLAKVLEATPVPVEVPPPTAVVEATPAPTDSFADVGDTLDVDARLAEKACQQSAEDAGATQRQERLDTLARTQQEAAAMAWERVFPELERCRALPTSERQGCLTTIDQWLAAGSELTVALPAGVETVQTDCGPRESVFEAASLPVEVAGRDAATALRAALADAPSAGLIDTPSGKVGIEWVALPAGSVKGALVEAFELARTEVTVGQYRACMDDGACTTPREAEACTWSRPDHVTHPVTCVSHSQAAAFATWVGARLPTEAEWSHAAGSAQSWAHPWGDEPASCARVVMAEATGAGCGRDDTWPVCSKPDGQSQQGVCDLSGNVWEWVGAEGGTARGGSAAQNRADDMAASVRLRGDASRQDVYVGFRVAR